jgi:hypothetical protein
MAASKLEKAVVRYLELRRSNQASSRELDQAIEAMAAALPKSQQRRVGLPQTA